jgi:hypothetical protein
MITSLSERLNATHPGPRDRMKHEHVLLSNARNLILMIFLARGVQCFEAVKAKVFATDFGRLLTLNG